MRFRYASIAAVAIAFATACSQQSSTVPSLATATNGKTDAVVRHASQTPEFLYTSSGDREIQAFRIDSKTGALSKVTGSPYDCGTGGARYSDRSIVADSAGRFLYCPAPLSRLIVGYSIDATSGMLAPLPGSPFHDPFGKPNHLVLTPRLRYLFVEHRTKMTATNRIGVFAVDAKTGALTPTSGSPYANGETAPVGMLVSPSSRYLYLSEVNQTAHVGDVSGFAIDARSGALKPVPDSPFSAVPNVELPVMTPSGGFLYLPGSENMPSTPGIVVGYAVDAKTGTLQRLGDTYASGYIQCIAISPSGKFLFVPYLTSSQDAIETYAIGKTGTLSQASAAPVDVGEYDYAAVDPSGRYLYVAGSDRAYAFAIHPASGALNPVVGSPFRIGRITGPLAIVQPR